MASVSSVIIAKIRVILSRGIEIAADFAAWVYVWAPESIRGKLLGWVSRVLFLSRSFRVGIETNLVRAYSGGAPERRDLRERLFLESGARRLRGFLENRTSRAPRVRGMDQWNSLGDRRASAILIVSALGNPERVFRWLKTDAQEARNAVIFGPIEIAAGKRSPTVRVPFFGLPVAMPTSPAEYAKATGATLVPVISYRGARDGDLWIEFLSPLEWVGMPAEPELEIAINTARLAGVLEERIRAYPKDWPWWMLRSDSNFAPLFDGEWRVPRSGG